MTHNFRYLLVAALLVSSSLLAEDYMLWGTVINHDTPIYNPGEKMVFQIKLLDGKKNVAGKLIKWKRTGDDGMSLDGTAITTDRGITVETSMDKPGFVRLYATAWEPDGKKILKRIAKNSKDKKLFFDGGAGVAPETLQGIAEPEDFDNYWIKQKLKLAQVPMEVLEKKKIEESEKGVIFDVKIACAGGMPVSGYLMIPRNAKEKSLKAVVGFSGYGIGSAGYSMKEAESRIRLNINAHGIPNGMSKDYYKGLTKLKGYAFDKKENSDTDTAYFNGMFMRVMRALEYVKSLPEWNGKDLGTIGGSQGGLQSLIGAGLDRDVNNCYAWSPWCCDIGRTELGRNMGGWGLDYTPALRYYDPVNHVKRANPACKLKIISNLGDYVCPPSGVWVAYNNFPGPKVMEMRQGCEHQYNMPNYPSYIFEKNN